MFLRRSWRRADLAGLEGSLSDVPLQQKWSRRSVFATPSYDRSLHENVILLLTWLLSCVSSRVSYRSLSVSCRSLGVSCRSSGVSVRAKGTSCWRMGVSGWKIAERYYTI
jgi:hypothetical protein